MRTTNFYVLAIGLAFIVFGFWGTVVSSNQVSTADAAFAHKETVLILWGSVICAFTGGIMLAYSIFGRNYRSYWTIKDLNNIGFRIVHMGVPDASKMIEMGIKIGKASYLFRTHIYNFANQNPQVGQGYYKTPSGTLCELSD